MSAGKLESVGIFAVLKRVKFLFLVASCVGLMATNVASLLNVSVHDWLSSGLEKVLSIGGDAFAERAMRNSPKNRMDAEVKARTIKLEGRVEDLSRLNKAQADLLDSAKIENKRLLEKIHMNGRTAKETVAVVNQRLTKAVARNLAALPSEAVPYLGLGVTIAVTSLDLYDACQTMKDFNGLLSLMGQGEENPEFCGQKVPSIEQVLLTSKDQWRNSVDAIKAEAAGKLVWPDVRLPTQDDLVNLVCPVVSIPFICS